MGDGNDITFGDSNEIVLTHVHDTGLLLTDTGGSPTLQLHDSNESVSSDGTNLILTSGGTAFKMPTSDGTGGHFLKTDGAGNFSFAAASGGSTDLNSLSAGVLNTASDSIAFIDADDSNTSKKETVADFLTAIAGSGITVSGNQLTASGGGGGGTTYEEFKINYSTAGQVQSISDTSSGISSVNIDSAAGGDLTVNFTGYTCLLYTSDAADE